eukprot:TRINITY_DN15798_c0_g2_i1.p1 TRINITY_DN15798_c0_g2~~TRINITY_DN15798_c0_g2_i1.p1  ORF type:complete len:877 (-),score=133.17 TRINITY_DN15798_c0_g2_i1:54-2621(-)
MFAPTAAAAAVSAADSDAGSVASGIAAGSGDSTRSPGSSQTAPISAPRSSNAGARGKSGTYLGWHSGTIKNFNKQHGYGFIDCEVVRARCNQDVFLSRDCVEDFMVGCPVFFEAYLDRDGRPRARNLKRNNWADVKVMPERQCAHEVLEELGVHYGFIKFFNHRQGFGFIKSDSLEAQAFVHRSQIRCFSKGCGVRFAAYKDSKGRVKARDLQPISHGWKVNEKAVVLESVPALTDGYLSVSEGTVLTLEHVQTEEEEPQPKERCVYARDAAGNAGWLFISSLARFPSVRLKKDTHPAEPLPSRLRATVRSDVSASGGGYLSAAKGTCLKLLHLQDGEGENEHAWLFAEDPSGQQGWISIANVCMLEGGEANACAIVATAREDVSKDASSGYMSTSKGAAIRVLYLDDGYIYGVDPADNKGWLSLASVSLRIAGPAAEDGYLRGKAHDDVTVFFCGEPDADAETGWLYGQLESGSSRGYFKCCLASIQLEDEPAARTDGILSDIAPPKLNAGLAEALAVAATGSPPEVAVVAESSPPEVPADEGREVVPDAPSPEETPEVAPSTPLEGPARAPPPSPPPAPVPPPPPPPLAEPLAPEPSSPMNAESDAPPAAEPLAPEPSSPMHVESDADCGQVRLLGTSSAWEYPLRDLENRSFVGLRRGALTPAQVKRFLHLVMDGVDELGGWEKPGGITRGTRWFVEKGWEYPYRYGNIVADPVRFPAWLREIIAVVLPHCGLAPEEAPNSCNVNCYADGTDGIDWHADDEPLFQGAVQDCRIISLSFGQERSFELRRKGSYGSSEVTRLRLAAGDLCTMEGLTQKFYEHRVPKCSANARLRVNLTFRWIVADAAGRKSWGW